MSDPDNPSSAENGSNLTSTILRTAKVLAIVTIIYYIGFLGLSVAWIYCMVIAITITKNWAQEKREKWNVARALALGYEKDILLTKLQHLPSWVHFPDVERVEWLNRIIKQTWTRVNHYARDLIPSLIEPAVQSYNKSFKFDEVVLGNVPIRIDGIKVYDEDMSRNKIVMDMDITYAGDCRITFQVAGVKGGIEDFLLRGRLRIVMKPLISTIPLIGGLQIYFMEEPEIDFDLVGVAQVLSMPGLRSFIEKAVVDTINSMFLFPNMLPIKLSDKVDTADVKIVEPEGIVRVHLVEAKHLMKKDINIMGTGKSDPYTVLRLGPNEIKTHIIDNTVDPKWDFWCEFESEIHSELKLYVWDHDEGSKDEKLGKASINISHIVKKGSEDLWLPLQDVMHGMIHIRLSWLTLSPNYSDLEPALHQMREIRQKLHSSLLVVYIESAKNLQQVKLSSLPDPYVVIRIEKTSDQTSVANHTCDPMWEKSFNFMINNPKTAILVMTIIDKKSGNDMGEISYKIRELEDRPNLEINHRPFVLSKSGPESTILCSLKLRIFKNTPNPNLVNDENISEQPNGNNSEAIEESSEFSKSIPPLTKRESSMSIIYNGNKNGTSTEIIENAQEKEIQQSLSSPRESISSTISTNLLERGTIKITLRYSVQRQKLIVVVHEVAGISGKSSSSQMPDAYVKMYLLPGKHKDTKKKTRVIKDSSTPVFDETFEYLINETDLKASQLEVTVATAKKVFDIGNRSIGQIVIDLGAINLAQGHVGWFDLLKAKKD